MHAATIETSVADRAYGLAACAADRVLSVYDAYGSYAHRVFFTKHITRIRLQRAISSATRNMQQLIDVLDQSTEFVAEHCESISVDARRKQPFSSMAELLNGALYSLEGLRNQHIEGAEDLYRLGAQARNKAARIASMLRQMEAPTALFESDFDREALPGLASQATQALDQQIKH